MNRLGKLIVTGLGTGYLPIAPGTWGSAAVCAIFLAATYLGNASPVLTNGLMLAVAVAASVACVALGGFAESAFGKIDPSQCTIDEWAGQAVALLLLPLGADGRGWLACAAAFLAFRVFDIVKPPPAMGLQKLPRGWGILIDDLIAGVYANIVAQLFLRLVLPALS